MWATHTDSEEDCVPPYQTSALCKLAVPKTKNKIHAGKFESRLSSRDVMSRSRSWLWVRVGPGGIQEASAYFRLVLNYQTRGQRNENLFWNQTTTILPSKRTSKQTGRKHKRQRKKDKERSMQ